MIEPRYWLTGRQWFGAMAPVAKISARDLSRRCDPFALQAGLESPHDLEQSPGTPDSDFFVVQLATQLWFLLTRPPFPPRRRVLALATADLTCALNGFRLSLDRGERTALAREADRVVGARDEIEGWLRRGLRKLPPREAWRARAEALSGLRAPYSHRLTLYISRPRTRLSEAHEERLSALVPELQQTAVEVAKRKLPWELWPAGRDAGEFSEDEREMLGPIRVEAPADYNAHIDDADENCRLNRPRLWRANVLVILTLDGGSHGTGTEHEMVSEGTATAIVRWRCDGPISPAIAGNLPGKPALVLDVDSDEDVVGQLEQFLEVNWHLIERCWRATEMRPLIWGPLAQEFATRVSALDPDAEDDLLVLRNPGFDPVTLAAACDPDGLAWLSTDAIRRAAAALGFSADSYLGGPPRHELAPRQLDALAEFQHEYGAPPAEVKVLRREAEQQQEVGILRFALTSVGDWSDFRDQYRAERG